MGNAVFASKRYFQVIAVAFAAVLSAVFAATLVCGAFAEECQAKTTQYGVLVCPSAMRANMGVGDWGQDGHAQSVKIKNGRLAISHDGYFSNYTTQRATFTRYGSSVYSFKLSKRVKYYTKLRFKQGYNGYSRYAYSYKGSAKSKSAFLKKLKAANRASNPQYMRHVVFTVKDGKVTKVGISLTRNEYY